MSGRMLRRWFAGAVLTAVTVFLVLGPRPVGAQQQDEISRKVKTKIAPIYPDLARRMSISGAVKVQVIVAPNGTVKNAKVMGGHPLLVNAAMDAVKKWKFEPASEETTGVVEFKFDPSAAQ